MAPLLLLLLALIKADASTVPDPAEIVPAERACVPLRQECVDISARCRHLQCSADAVCALDPDTMAVTCLPAVVRQLQNCGPEQLRLSQPCPADASIRWLGQGCTFCERAEQEMQIDPIGQSFVSKKGKRQSQHSNETVQQGQEQSLAMCMMIFSDSHDLETKCIETSKKCRQLKCPKGTICGLSRDEETACFPVSAEDSEDCKTDVTEQLPHHCIDDANISEKKHNCVFRMCDKTMH